MRLGFWSRSRKVDADVLGHFSPLAKAYAIARPAYQPEAIDFVLGGLSTDSVEAVDVGAGTGILSRQIADRLTGRSTVIAVEPNAEMRAESTPHQRIVVRNATAERTGLGAATVNLVVCGQAFHWFDAGAAMNEFARILTAGGRLAVVDVRRDETVASNGAMTGLFMRYGAAAGRRMPGSQAGALHGHREFTPPESAQFRNTHECSFPDFLMLTRSFAQYPKDPAEAIAFDRELEAIFGRHANSKGLIELPAVTTVHRLQRR